MPFKVVSEDGEIVGHINEGDRIVRKQSLDFLRNQRDTTQEWKMEHFFKGNTDEIRKIMCELSVFEKAFLFAVATYVGYEDCCLKYDNGRELSFDSLAEIVGFSRGKLSEVMTGLIDKDIIYRGKNSSSRQYFVNPWIFCKGNRINRVLKTMFKNYRVRVMNGTPWSDMRE